MNTEENNEVKVDTSEEIVVEVETQEDNKVITPEQEYISYEDFSKVEMTVGQIDAVEIVQNADKLLKLTVNFGDHSRQIVSGIRAYYEDEQELVGKKCPFATNLAPRMIRGLESNGMIVAVNDKNGNGFSLLEAGENISPGSKLS